jgi:hypothetical protein
MPVPFYLCEKPSQARAIASRLLEYVTPLDEHLSVLQQQREDSPPCIFSGSTSKAGKSFNAARRYNARKKHAGESAPGVDVVISY